MKTYSTCDIRFFGNNGSEWCSWEDVSDIEKENANLRAEVERLRGEMPNCVKPGDGKGGWSLDYKQILRVKELACAIEDVCMEKTEAVMLAMIECGQALAETETE